MSSAETPAAPRGRGAVVGFGESPPAGGIGVLEAPTAGGLPAAPGHRLARGARLRGALLAELPADLYIPPDALEVVLDAFEGPLDLLLYLIRRQNLDVRDIPMVEITRQYLAYIEALQAGRFELAGEYLAMAAVLIEIKSRLLLPRPAATAAEAEDPRAELVRRLVEYEQMKLAAQRLDQLPTRDRDYFVAAVPPPEAATRLPAVAPADLLAVWRQMLGRARLFEAHTVTAEALSVLEQMARVLARLRGGGWAEFAALIPEPYGVAEVVVVFLAVLELAKDGAVVLTQRAFPGVIHLTLAGPPAPGTAP